MQSSIPDYRSRRKNTNLSVPPLLVKRNPPKTSSVIPISETRPLTPEKKTNNDYIQRIRSIYSPNTIEKTPPKNYKLHSKMSLYKGKLSNPELKDESIVRTFDVSSREESKLKKGFEVIYDNQKYIIQANKFDHLTVRVAEKEIMNKAREDIIKVFPLYINTSNAISIIPSQNPNYLYYIGKGNNSELIKRIFISRS